MNRNTGWFGRTCVRLCLGFILFCIGRLPLAAEVPVRTHKSAKVQTSAVPGAASSVLWTRVISSEKDRYCGWPTVCRRADGELLVVFSGDRSKHVCPWGRTLLVRSKDGGETWSRSVVAHNDSLDDRDAGIVELADGTLVLTWFSSLAYLGDNGWQGPSPIDWRLHYEKLPKDLVDREHGSFTSRSKDGGRTWESPVLHAGSAPHGCIRLRSGRILQVGRFIDGGSATVAEGRRLDSEFGAHLLPVEVSDDGAKSWRTLSVIRPQPPYEAELCFEPHAIELDDGTILAQFRYHPKCSAREVQYRRRIVQTTSEDGGMTWSPFVETGIIGYPPHLLKLKDGRLLASYGCRTPGRIGIRASLSSNSGRTWDVAREIELTRQTNDDLGYASSVQLDDGTILTVYYQVAVPGGVPALMATKWRVK